MNDINAIESALTANHIGAARQAACEYVAAAREPAVHAQSIGQLLKRLYDQYHAAAVQSFYDQVIPEFPDEVAANMRQPVKDDVELTRQWNTRLNDMANERLVDDLVSRVKSGDTAGALEAATVLIATADNRESFVMRARQTGVVLGGMIYERERAAALVRSISRNPQKYGIDAMIAADMEEEYQKAVTASVRRERDSAAVSRMEITQAVVELSRALPGRMAIHEPSDDDVDLFARQLRALLRCCLTSRGFDKYYETTMILAEFAPKELSVMGAAAGVEKRLHASLGRTARLAASRALAAAGAEPAVFKSYMEFSKANITGRFGRFTVEVLGLFQNPAAVSFIAESMTNRKLNARTEAQQALGAIGGQAVQRALSHALRDDLRARVLESETRRDAVTILRALGRVARGADPARRSALTAEVIKMLPPDDTELKVQAAISLFAGKLDGVDTKNIEWAARAATAALWQADRPESASGRGSRPPLGFRQPLLELLERLAPLVMPVINSTALSCAKQFSGAYLALAEFYTKIAEPQSLAVLRQLLINTFLYDDTLRQSEYTREMVVDAATNERTVLTKDIVLASLIGAVSKIGGAEADELLYDLFQQIQSGRLPKSVAGNADVAASLMDAHMRIARGRGESAFARPATGAPAAGPEIETHTSEATVTEEDLRFMRELQANYFFSGKRREKKVGAMAALARRRITPALPVIIRNLTDKDSIVAGAAMTALIDYAVQDIQPRQLQLLHEELFAALEIGDNAMRERIGNLLLKLGPRRSPLKERLEEFAKRPGIPAGLAAMIAKMSGPPPEKASPDARKTGPTAPPPEEAEPDSPINKHLPRKGAAAMTPLDKKRAYMLVRQEWIRGGKHGPEPKMPE
ncbi:MAG: HEAT repeat domain-containing protein [Candidatus Sumerlaeota bacterium]|nr:HEAT repeat domain-containing protein [Candidatus Sumerlaeota bacterium]